jgi:uncharacterized protein YndB with AHSA1/START domain
MNARRVLSAVGRVAAALAVMLLAASLTFVVFCRSWAFTWGATSREAAAAMPGDALVAAAGTVSTRAVTIEAPVEQVWPWLVQFGQGRGGLYSYDWAERLAGVDVVNADRVLPEHQRIAVGDLIWVTQDGYPAKLVFVVAEVVPPRSLVLAFTEDPRPGVVPPRTGWTWSFTLTPDGPSRTRLVLRSRNEPFPNAVARGATAGLIDPIDFVMSRKTLLGIKERAERLAGRDTASPAEPLLWLALAIGGLATAVLAVRRRLSAPWRLGAGAVAAALLALALFRGFPNPLYAVLVDAAVAAALITQVVMERRSRQDASAMRVTAAPSSTPSGGRMSITPPP